MPKTLGTAAHRALVESLIGYRVAAGMTQSELASRLHVQQPFVAKLEGGHRRIDLVELVEISRILGFDIHELVGRVLKAGD